MVILGLNGIDFKRLFEKYKKTIRPSRYDNQGHPHKLNNKLTSLINGKKFNNNNALLSL